ncbi:MULTISPECIES: MFS transporter permease [unclassified Modestobacter]|uniref:MFS transporter permease n=1 Tax=unclassified Modestobacter TaxID=2643866 RepID=UPI0022AB4CCB|nr:MULTISPECIES: MFS transporter permease [unclassified Modestobacter]MCZ2812391.1 MFS transporter permease [Modestobacter sp. VKM Ac-2979]MCZ2841281.1 MFS transporter permease [Modestobacter sp. VKM Ac-2980]MCZ2850000.1 MFS transporter permease [Modestobacter sp. VKM Ac-2978]
MSTAATTPGTAAPVRPEVAPAVPGTPRWWFRPVPLARIAVFRAIAYLFIPVDVFLTTAWVRAHADVPTDWYAPLLIGRLLNLPTPTHTLVLVVQWALVIAAVAAATGRAPRLLGLAVFLLYSEWMVIAMSYGKVDHDRIAFLVALAVLPTIGRARLRDRRSSEAAGFAMAAVLVTVMLTYFLAAWAKIRFGGWDWATGATLTRALVRRGTDLSMWTLDVAWLLPTVQWVMIGLELAAPLILLVRTDRARIGLVLFLLGFHAMVYAGVTIIFLPHCVAILSILPWERLTVLQRRDSPAGLPAVPGTPAPG